MFYLISLLLVYYFFRESFFFCLHFFFSRYEEEKISDVFNSFFFLSFFFREMKRIFHRWVLFFCHWLRCVSENLFQLNFSFSFVNAATILICSRFQKNDFFFLSGQKRLNHVFVEIKDVQSRKSRWCQGLLRLYFVWLLRGFRSFELNKLRLFRVVRRWRLNSHRWSNENGKL